MPKISDAHRQMRRNQILEAAWRCFQRNGVQATTIDDVISEAGLSASAMYRYFKGKDDIIFAAISTSLGGLAERFEPLLADEAIASPAEFLAKAMALVDAFTARRGYNLASIAVHGWSEAQRNRKVRDLIASFYGAFLERLSERVRRWQKTGVIARAARAGDVARGMHAVVLGHVVQAAIMGNADPKATARGLAALHG